MSDQNTPSTPVIEAPASTEVASENLETQENLEAEEEAKDASAEAPKEPKKEEAPKKNSRKFKLKVDGKEFEEEVNLDDDEYLTRHFQLAKASQKRMQEYSQLQKDVADFVKELKENPRKVLSDPNIGVDIKEFAAMILEEEIANSQKSPEQLAKEKLEGRLKELEDERKAEKEEFKRQEFQRLQQQAHDDYDRQISAALETTDLPKSPYIVKKVADYMLLALQNGVDASPADVLPLVRDEMVNDLKEMFGVMPDEVIESIVGKDVITRIRKKSIAKAKAQGTPPAPLKSGLKDTGTSTKKEEEVKKKMSFKEFLGV